ncbi:MAG: pilus assembly protein PilM [Candidatus Omnitrophica bacterium]|nr:pilus assembly protein PilM [Candidatus Omnitrophota bacterium]
MSKHSVGVYISSKYVDIAILGGALNSPRLLNFIREEIPAAPAQKQAAVPESAGEALAQAPAEDPVALAIRSGLQKAKMKHAEAYTVLPSRDVMIRHFNMPQLPKAEQAQALKFEARKYVPFKIDEIACDFKVSPSAKDKKAADVFFVAVNKAQLNNQMDLFKAAGAVAAGVDIATLAQVRMLLLEKKITSKDDVAILYIDNDGESASFHIVEKGMPFLSRDFKISTDDKEALSEKIISEVRVSFDYYRRQKAQVKVSKIVICGEALQIDLSSAMSDDLHITTETLEKFTVVKGSAETPASSIVAIGTALGGLGKSPYSVNLSPVAVVTQKKKVTSGLIAGGIAAVVIIIAVFLLTGVKTSGIRAELSAVKDRGKNVLAKNISLDAGKLNKKKKRYATEINFLKFLLSDRISWAQKMDRIAKDMPQEVWIDKITMRESFTKKNRTYPTKIGRSISIEGSAFSEDGVIGTESVNKFYTALEKDAIFMKHLNTIRLGATDKKIAGEHSINIFKISVGSGGKLPGKAKSRWRR